MSVFVPGKLVLAMSSMQRSSFDFVGSYVDEDAQFFYLANPLVLDYSEERSLLRLAPLHLPIGCVDVQAGNLLAIPKEALAYAVQLNSSDDWLATEYGKFFKEA